MARLNYLITSICFKRWDILEDFLSLLGYTPSFHSPSEGPVHKPIGHENTVKFRKYAPPCLSPSKYKPPKLVTQKTPPLNRPSKYKPFGGLYLEIALKYKVKQNKNGKFTSNYKASPIDFETQISLRR